MNLNVYILPPLNLIFSQAMLKIVVYQMLIVTNCGWPPVVHTTRGVANNQHERPKRSLFTGPRYNTFFLLLSSWILSPELTIV